MAEVTLLPEELQQWCQQYQAPTWVYRSVLHQCSKICKNKIKGYHEKSKIC